jgi:hypothetical protein
MTPRTTQCEVFWSSKSSSECSGVPEDSNPNFFQVLGFTPTLGQSGVATTTIFVAFICNKTIEESDGSYCRFFLFLKHKEEGDDNKVATTPP